MMTATGDAQRWEAERAVDRLIAAVLQARTRIEEDEFDEPRIVIEDQVVEECVEEVLALISPTPSLAPARRCWPDPALLMALLKLSARPRGQRHIRRQATEGVGVMITPTLASDMMHAIDLSLPFWEEHPGLVDVQEMREIYSALAAALAQEAER